MGGIDVGRGDANNDSAYGKEECAMPWQTDRVEDAPPLYIRTRVSQRHFGEGQRSEGGMASDPHINEAGGAYIDTLEQSDECLSESIVSSEQDSLADQL